MDKEEFQHQMRLKFEKEDFEQALRAQVELQLRIEQKYKPTQPQISHTEPQSVSAALIFVVWEKLNSAVLALYGDFIFTKFIEPGGGKKADPTSPRIINEIQKCIWKLDNKKKGILWMQAVYAASNYTRHFSEWNYFVMTNLQKYNQRSSGMISFSSDDLQKIVQSAPQAENYILNINVLIANGLWPMDFLVTGFNARYVVNELKLNDFGYTQEMFNLCLEDLEALTKSVN